ncbi:hypothetical protein KIF53_06575 [Chromobacterium subtsugae]|uniref:Lipoprotein n=2 Tax=Chromobacterium subtsugae TaxID=251747 RepID=A0ABS7FCX5_9NEIS|nr:MULTISPECIES: hypothetical protein [Chromobacterium]KUM03911.1 hypothetical protein Cv017_17285 [Chromobacterium subtsugae]KZE85574.1 hypothetical protein AWB61_18680 [Chromobacterium sp. F49]MBW7566169.1 hypothetical protein [Chromobacterium subtsugae]MBW8287290.1 hypothetical protein [Chromobacterium subtsugae]OBU87446.1 hypothetical protein MY55_04625 [Chromobacterium subtsugae]
MKKILAGSLIIASSLCFTGCTSMRVIADNQQALSSLASPQQSQLKPGDKISLKTTDGKEYTLVLSAIDQQGLEGKLTDSEQLTRLAWQNISAVQKNEIDGVKTAGLILLLSGATFAIGKAFLSMFPG